MKLIDADALMEAIEIRMKSKEDDFKAVSELMAINRYIAQASPVKKQDREWIPVTERLPSTSGRFEVTIKGSKGKRYVEMCDFQKDANPDWRWGGRYNTKNVIAWRARPVPYKGK